MKTLKDFFIIQNSVFYCININIKLKKNPQINLIFDQNLGIAKDLKVTSDIKASLIFSYANWFYKIPDKNSKIVLVVELLKEWRFFDFIH